MILAIASVVRGLGVFAAPGNLLEMQKPRPTEVKSAF